MLTLKLHYIIRINKRTLPCIALSLYLLQEMIYAIFSIAFGGGGTARIFTIIVMYLPLIAMLFFQGDKRDVKDFFVLLIFFIRNTTNGFLKVPIRSRL